MKLSKKSTYIVSAVALAAVISATGIYASTKMHRWHGGAMQTAMFMGHGPMHLFKLADELELTEQQRDEIGALMDSNKSILRDAMFEMMDNRKELKALIQEDTVSDEELRVFTEEQGKLIADMMYMRIKMLTDIKTVLTDEQREKLKEHMANAPDGHRGHGRGFRGWRHWN